MKYYFIYQTTNKVTGKIYIGKHSTTNIKDNYLGSNQELKNDIKKYGIKNFDRTILCFCKNQTELSQKEKEYVTKEFCKLNNTYNRNIGGSGSFDYINQTLTYEQLSSRSKKGMNEFKKDTQRYETWKKVLSVATKIAFKNEEVRRKQSLGLKNNPIISAGTFTGKHHSDQTKQKISLKNKILLKGSSNYMTGKCWICNDITKETKIILKDELETYINQGWRKGRYYQNSPISIHQP